MVIFKTRRKVRELEKKVVNLEVTLRFFEENSKKSNDYIEDLAELVDEIKLMVENLSEDGSQSKTAQQLLREYFFGKEEDK